jgi:acyl-ACP thioesterase
MGSRPPIHDCSSEPEMETQAPSELVGPPPGGRVFEGEARTGFADCAPSGRIRLDALARWLQDVAYADVEDAGLASMAVWVVRRTRICVRRFPRFGERFSVATFCSGLGRMWGERRTTVGRLGEAKADVESVAVWVHLDPVSWRPVPFDDREAELYGSAAAGRRVSARLRHPPPAPEASTGTWTFRAVDLDIAGHVNNAAYWEPLEEELLAGPEVERIDAEIEFRTPCQPGAKALVQAGPRRWIVGDGETHASVLVSDLVTQGEARRGH